MVEIQKQQKETEAQKHKRIQYMLTIQKFSTHLKDTHKRKKKVYINKMKTNGTIGAINRKWENRKNRTTSTRTTKGTRK